MRRAPAPPPLAPAWWNDPRYTWTLVLLCALPLLWPSLPPLTDALGHLARYHVELSIGTSPYLKHYFAFKWALVGNLGVDLLIIPMAKVFGLQLGLKLIVIAIPVLTATGLLLVAREVHGRASPLFAFALPLTYGFPFQFGFLNHVLSMAFALLAFALWLRLGRQKRLRLRAALFVPIGALIWLTHVYGWAVLGLLCFAAELVRDRGEGLSRWRSVWAAALSTLPLAPPVLLMLAWRSGDVKGVTGDWFHWFAKYSWLIETLRDRWKTFDMVSVAMLVLLLVAGAIPGVRLRYERTLGIATLLLLIAYVLIPRILLGSAYADMRLMPYAIAVGLIGLRLTEAGTPRLASGLALVGLLFFAARIGTTTWNFIGYDRAYQAQLKAIDHIAPGSRVMVLVNLTCQGAWVSTRMDHLGSQAIVRKDAFVNGQWVMPGAQLMSITYKAAGRFAPDPSQLLRPARCRAPNEPRLDDTVAHFPRDAFDYFWLIDMPPEGWVHDPGLIPIWTGPRGILYRVAHPQPPEAEPGAARPDQARSATIPSETPKGREPRPTQ